MPGYNLITFDHSSNQNRGGIFKYHKDFLPVKLNNVTYLKRSLNFNLIVNGEQCNITLNYCSPSQSSEEFGISLINCAFLLNSISN